MIRRIDEEGFIIVWGNTKVKNGERSQGRRNRAGVVASSRALVLFSSSAVALSSSACRVTESDHVWNHVVVAKETERHRQIDKGC